MKITISVLAFSLVHFFSFGQEGSNTSEKIRRNEKIQVTNSITPLFVISCNKMKLEIKSGESQQDLLRQINPNWIDSINVLKGLNALNKYGSSAENGAVEILIKRGDFLKIPETLRNTFQLIEEKD